MTKTNAILIILFLNKQGEACAPRYDGPKRSVTYYRIPITDILTVTLVSE